MRRLPLLAGPAALVVVRPPRVRVPAAGRRGALPRRRHRPQVLRPGRQELHEVPRRHADREVRLRPDAAARAHRVGRDRRRRALPERQDGGRAQGAGAAPHDLHREQPRQRVGRALHRRSRRRVRSATSPPSRYVTEPLGPVLEQHRATSKRSARRPRLDAASSSSTSPTTTSGPSTSSSRTTSSPRRATRWA